MTLHEAKIELQDLYDEYRHLEQNAEAWGVGVAMAVINSVDDYSKQCIECGKWYTPTNPFGQKFCSEMCKNKHKKKNMEAKKMKLNKKEVMDAIEKAHDANKPFLVAVLNDNLVSTLANGNAKDLLAIAYGIITSVCEEAGMKKEKFFKIAMIAEKLEAKDDNKRNG